MKNKRLYTKLLLGGGFLMTSLAFTSCDDFLTILPTDQIPEEHFWQEKEDLENVRAGAYEKLSESGLTSKILAWGELRSDNLSLNNVQQTAINYLQEGVLQPSESMFDWSGFYSGINYCNLVIEQGNAMTSNTGNETDPSYSRSDYLVTRAEMMALRSLYYFYLVRAYRDVPYVEKSIRSDEEARQSYPSATPGVAVLDTCINVLEANLQYGANNYGSDADNKGRFTKTGIHALLADMYLWRACMLKKYVTKTNSMESDSTDRADYLKASFPHATETVTDAYCETLSSECLEKCIEHCDEVLTALKKDYDEDVDLMSESTEKERYKHQKFPLYLSSDANSLNDNAYGMNFGSQNSRESVFELQYDGSTTKNSTVNTYFSTYSNNEFTPGYMAVANILLAGATSVDPEQGFGKTDLRLWETTYYGGKNTVYPVSKFVMTSLTVSDYEDLSASTTTGTVSCRTSEANNAHWPVYRLADIMLIKAEAIARMAPTDLSSTATNSLKMGYLLVNQLFKRNNPALDTEVNASAETNARIDNYGTYSNTTGEFNSTALGDTYTAANLLSLVYRERQREFVGEGKRWFDIVRQAEASNDAKTTLTDYITTKSSVKTRLSSLWAFYVPIYSEELKVNGVEEGGNLKQNPVWDRYTKK